MRASVLKFAIVLLSMNFIAAMTGPASAACVAAFPVTITPASATLPSYDPFSTSDTTLDMTLTFTESLLAVCQAAVSFTRTAGLPALMSQGGSSLQYSIETTSGQTLMQTTGYVSGSSPAVANRLDFLLPVLGSVNQTVRIRVPAGQLVAAGNYSDVQTNLTLVALGPVLGSAPAALIKQQPFVPSINVFSKCILPPPSASTLDFTSAISNGLPNPGVQHSTVFNNVQCTAPSILRLSGGPMQPLVSIPAQTGFDTFINWKAAGTFGNASTVLSTDSASQASSATKNTPSGVTANGTIGVNVNLLRGNPIIAGSYQGTLTVTIDPNL
jgi:hypothetical protein